MYIQKTDVGMDMDILIFGSCRVHGIPYGSYKTHKPFDLLHTTKHAISNITLDSSRLPLELRSYASFKQKPFILPKSPTFIVVEHCSRKIVYDASDHGILYNCNRIGGFYHVMCRFEKSINKYFMLKSGYLQIRNDILPTVLFRYFKGVNARKTPTSVSGTGGTHLEWDDLGKAVFFPWIEMNRRVCKNDTVVLTLSITIGTPKDGYFLRWYNGVSYVTDKTRLGYKPTTVILKTPVIPSSKLSSLRISVCTRVPEYKAEPIEICIHTMNIVVESCTIAGGVTVSENTRHETSPGKSHLGEDEIGYAMIERKQTLQELLQDTLMLKQLYPKSIIVFVPHIRVQTDDPVISIVMKSRKANKDMLEEVCSYFKRCHVFPLSNILQESMLEERSNGDIDLNHYNAYGKGEVGRILTRFLEELCD